MDSHSRSAPGPRIPPPPAATPCAGFAAPIDRLDLLDLVRLADLIRFTPVACTWACDSTSTCSCALCRSRSAFSSACRVPNTDDAAPTCSITVHIDQGDLRDWLSGIRLSGTSCWNHATIRIAAPKETKVSSESPGGTVHLSPLNETQRRTCVHGSVSVFSSCCLWLPVTCSAGTADANVAAPQASR